MYTVGLQFDQEAIAYGLVINDLKLITKLVLQKNTNSQFTVYELVIITSTEILRDRNYYELVIITSS